jgi:hypothetical protein
MFLELKQRQWWIRKHLTLLPDGLHYYSKDHENETDLKIEFSQVSSRDKSFVKTERYPKILNVAYFVAAIGILRSAVMYPSNAEFLTGVGISLALGLVGVLIYRLVKTDYFCILLDDNTALFLLRRNPSAKEVANFTDALFTARKAHYRKEYFFIDYEGERKQELERMKWLFSEKIITENEYLVVVDEINENLAD